MIQIGSSLSVVDNSGGRRALCIKVLHKKTRLYGVSGDLVVLTIKRLRYVFKLRRVVVGSMYTGVLVSVRKELNRRIGFCVRSGRNGVVILSPVLEPLGKRVRGGLFFELRLKGFLRIALMARYLF